jgi:hypothetical protein
MKAYSDLGPADFTVSYRFLRPDEGGLSRIPQQHTRWAFLYSEDDPQRDGAWDIWPEFLDSGGSPLPDGPVPTRGVAHMFILSSDLRPMHKARIRIGTKGYMIEGLRKVSECEVTQVLALAGDDGS